MLTKLEIDTLRRIIAVARCHISSGDCNVAAGAVDKMEAALRDERRREAQAREDFRAMCAGESDIRDLMDPF